MFHVKQIKINILDDGSLVIDLSGINRADSVLLMSHIIMQHAQNDIRAQESLIKPASAFDLLKIKGENHG